MACTVSVDYKALNFVMHMVVPNMACLSLFETPLVLGSFSLYDLIPKTTGMHIVFRAHMTVLVPKQLLHESQAY